MKLLSQLEESLWSHETKIELLGHHTKCHVWCKPNKVHHQKHTIPTKALWWKHHALDKLLCCSFWKEKGGKNVPHLGICQRLFYILSDSAFEQMRLVFLPSWETSCENWALHFNKS